MRHQRDTPKTPTQRPDISAGRCDVPETSGHIILVMLSWIGRGAFSVPTLPPGQDKPLTDRPTDRAAKTQTKVHHYQNHTTGDGSSKKKQGDASRCFPHDSPG